MERSRIGRFEDVLRLSPVIEKLEIQDSERQGLQHSIEFDEHVSCQKSQIETHRSEMERLTGRGRQ